MKNKSIKQLKVSIIIPVYNAENYLKKCLDNLINQTLKDIEIICINDGSNDGSLKILEEYANKDSRIKVFSQENSGPAVSRQNGINYSNGEYIGFVDSDDFIDKKYYEILYKNAIKNNAEISMTNNVVLFNPNSKNKNKNCGVDKNQKFAITRNEKSKIIITTGICCNKIYKREFILNNNLLYLGSHPGADNIFNATTVIMSNKIAVTNKVKYYYVQVSDSLVHKLKTEKAFNIINNYTYIDNWIENNRELSAKDKEYWEFVNYKRKNRDYKVFYDTMSEGCKEDFKKLVDESLKIKNLIVSLTSYPARINTVHLVIESLLNQTIKPEKIILWLAEEQFPNRENDLPQQLLDLVSRGLTIDWCSDLRSYKKIIPALEKYSDKTIITVDDDVIYNKYTIQKLYEAHLKTPNTIFCHRAHYITFKNKKINSYKSWLICTVKKCASFNMLQTGVGGVLYPVGCFYKDICRYDLFTKLAPDTDDIWLWAMAVLNDRKICAVKDNCTDFCFIDGTQQYGLWESKNSTGGNDVNIDNILNYYPEILGKLDKKDYIYRHFYERIFSIKDWDNKRIVTILGIKIKLKNKYLELESKINNLERRYCTLSYEFENFREKYK